MVLHAALKQLSILLRVDGVEGVGGDAEVAQVLFREQLRDPGVAVHGDKPLEPGGHAVHGLDRSPKRRHEHGVGMTMLADQLAGLLAGLLSPTVIQSAIVPVGVLASIVAVP